MLGRAPFFTDPASIPHPRAPQSLGRPDCRRRLRARADQSWHSQGKHDALTNLGDKRWQWLIGKCATRLPTDHRGADASVDDEGGTQRRTIHLRLSRISATMSLLAQKSYGLGCTGISTRSAASSAERASAAILRGPSMTRLIAAPGEFWGLLMQSFTSETDGTEKSRQSALIASLRPVERGALRVGVDEEYCLSSRREFACDVRRECRLADPAFLIEHCNDHYRGSAARMPFSGRFAGIAALMGRAVDCLSHGWCSVIEIASSASVRHRQGPRFAKIGTMMIGPAPPRDARYSMSVHGLGT